MDCSYLIILKSKLANIKIAINKLFQKWINLSLEAAAEISLQQLFEGFKDF